MGFHSYVLVLEEKEYKITAFFKLKGKWSFVYAFNKVLLFPEVKKRFIYMELNVV